MEQPPAEGDAVGLVVEFFRIEVIEGPQFGLFEDFGVQSGHAVDAVPIVDIDVGHVYPVLVVQNGHTGVAAHGFGAAVQFLDDGHQLGHRPAHKVHGPFFQASARMVWLV